MDFLFFHEDSNYVAPLQSADEDGNKLSVKSALKLSNDNDNISEFSLKSMKKLKEENISGKEIYFTFFSRTRIIGIYLYTYIYNLNKFKVMAKA